MVYQCKKTRDEDLVAIHLNQSDFRWRQSSLALVFLFLCSSGLASRCRKCSMVMCVSVTPLLVFRRRREGCCVDGQRELANAREREA